MTRDKPARKSPTELSAVETIAIALLLVLFEAGLARGEGGLSPAMVTVMSEKADYAFLSLKTNAFDLTDRGVSGRVVPSGADAFVYAERGVYRRGETVHATVLLRDDKTYPYLQLTLTERAPRLLVLENVAGLLTSRQGRDFAALATVLAQAIVRGASSVGEVRIASVAEAGQLLAQRPDLLLLSDKGYISAELDDYLHARGADLLRPSYRSRPPRPGRR